MTKIIACEENTPCSLDSEPGMFLGCVGVSCSCTAPLSVPEEDRPGMSVSQPAMKVDILSFIRLKNEFYRLLHRMSFNSVHSSTAFSS